MFLARHFQQDPHLVRRAPDRWLNNIANYGTREVGYQLPHVISRE